MAKWVYLTAQRYRLAPGGQGGQDGHVHYVYFVHQGSLCKWTKIGGHGHTPMKGMSCPPICPLDLSMSAVHFIGCEPANIVRPNTRHIDRTPAACGTD